MIEEKEEFFNEIKLIQDLAINIVLSNIEKYNSSEDVLKDATYETIYRMMELIDGYRNKNIKYNICNVNSGRSVNENIELHDLCEEYLQCTDI